MLTTGYGVRCSCLEFGGLSSFELGVDKEGISGLGCGVWVYPSVGVLFEFDC